MSKTALTGTPIREDVQYIVLDEDGAVAKYSRQFYRLSDEPEQPVQLAYGLHAIVVPFNS